MVFLEYLSYSLHIRYHMSYNHIIDWKIYKMPNLQCSHLGSHIYNIYITYTICAISIFYCGRPSVIWFWIIKINCFGWENNPSISADLSKFAMQPLVCCLNLSIWKSITKLIYTFMTKIGVYSIVSPFSDTYKERLGWDFGPIIYSRSYGKRY